MHFFSINYSLPSPFSSLSTCISSLITPIQELKIFTYLSSGGISMPKIMPSSVICVLLVLALFVQDFAECSSRGASMLQVHRQILLEMKMALKSGAPILGNNGSGQMPEDWQLRRVPAGPDPLHHNGQDPKKPRTP